MDDGPAMVERFWRLMEARDWRGARALLSDDFVAEWPASNARFPTPDAFMAMNEAHPAPDWHILSVAAQTANPEVVAEVLVTNADGADFAVGFYRVEGSGICHAREYWTERRTEPPPVWRAAWTEAIESFG